MGSEEEISKDNHISWDRLCNIINYIEGYPSGNGVIKSLECLKLERYVKDFPIPSTIYDPEKISWLEYTKENYADSPTILIGHLKFDISDPEAISWIEHQKKRYWSAKEEFNTGKRLCLDAESKSLHKLLEGATVYDKLTSIFDLEEIIKKIEIQNRPKEFVLYLSSSAFEELVSNEVERVFIDDNLEFSELGFKTLRIRGCSIHVKEYLPLSDPTTELNEFSGILIPFTGVSGKPLFVVEYSGDRHGVNSKIKGEFEGVIDGKAKFSFSMEMRFCADEKIIAFNKN